MQTGDTITAIASPPADSAARGIIRLSGPESFAIVEASLSPSEQSANRRKRGIVAPTLIMPRAIGVGRALRLPCLIALNPELNLGMTPAALAKVLSYLLFTVLSRRNSA